MKTFSISAAARLLVVWAALMAWSSAQTTSSLSTRFLARGEQAVLRISSINAMPDRAPQVQAPAGVLIQDTGFGGDARQLPGRRQIEHSFRYLVTSYEVGRHVIPAIEVFVGGTPVRTEPIEFVVFDPDDLQWAQVNVGGRTLRYASSLHVLDEQPYIGQTIPAEIKIYVPRPLASSVEDWGVPEFERDGMTAWRFQNEDSPGQINLLGSPHIAFNYPSTISPTRTGTVSIGPASVRLTTIQSVLDGFLRRDYEEVFLQIPRRDLEARPLPAGAPEGFDGAVGTFEMSASVPDPDVREGDPIAVDILVRGRGNLDALQAPRLTDDTGWKAYDAAPSQRGEERRFISGVVAFRQFLRPLELKPAVPPFRLVFFDPADETYKTITTQPITLNMSPGNRALSEGLAPPPTLAVPVERMTDILAVIRPASLTLAPGFAPPAWLGHLLAALAALALIAKALWMRFSHLLRQDPARTKRLRELNEIHRIPAADDNTFLKSAGAFVERWLADQSNPDLRGILAERDAVCFRSEKPSRILDRRRRNEIVKILRSAAGACLLAAGLAFGIPSAMAETDPTLTPSPGNTASEALEAYEAARYEDAIRIWLGAGRFEELSADTLYNIGNACFRLGSSGHAALYYRRALARDPGHQEARQNLRFIERKHGAITVTRPDYQYVLAKLPLSAWKGAVWTGVWLIVLGGLVFPASYRGANLRVAGVCALVAGPLLASAGALGWRYFPNDSVFAPLERQAVIIGENAVLHADAARTAPEVIDAPPGSLCEVIRQTGRWAYVAFATQTRGWVPLESIEMILPESPPEVPSIRKPKADASSA
jgi:tetratricopeptide (TPR) repeat protein